MSPAMGIGRHSVKSGGTFTWAAWWRPWAGQERNPFHSGGAKCGCKEFILSFPGNPGRSSGGRAHSLQGLYGHIFFWS